MNTNHPAGPAQAARLRGRTVRWTAGHVAGGLIALAALGLAGCASTPNPPVAVTGAPLNLQQAAQGLTDQVLERALRLRTWGSLFAGWSPQGVGLAPVIDTRARAAPAAAAQAARVIADRISRDHEAFAVWRPAGDGSLPQRWQLKTTLSPLPDAAPGQGRDDWALMLLELVDMASGQVVATARERVKDALLAPSQPVALVEAAKPAPGPAAAPAPTPAETLAALNAEYIALLRRGRDSEAQQVFSRIVTIGLTNRQIGVKLLFAPNSTAFWPDPLLQRRYASWLSEIARQLQDSPHCLQIVGHASRTGAPEANLRLSTRRAQAVRQIMLKESAALAPRLTTAGAGWEQSVAGTGTDDERDAADRRVDFKVVDCP
jgi:outer membrane protein OmpA-like peptidoglycan-associated protein